MIDGQEIAKIGSKSAPTFVLLKEFENVRLLDIRKYYRKDDKFLPTRKGISLTYDNYQSLINVMNEYNGDITSWLKGSGSLKGNSNESTFIEDTPEGIGRANQGSIELIFEKLRGSSLYEIEERGNKRTVRLNTRLNVVKEWQANETEFERSGALDIILGLDFAMSLIEDIDESMKELIIFNLSKHISQKAQSWKH